MDLQTFFYSLPILAEVPSGVIKLRGLILHLAYRGKLVPQITEEGTTNSLLKKIESAKSSQNGTTSKTHKLPDIYADERPHDIPLTWKWVRLGEVIDYDCAKKVSPAQIANNAWLLDLADIEKDSSRIVQKLTFADRRSKSNKSQFVVGDVLYGKLRPYLNKVVVADEAGYCTTEIVAMRGYFGVEPKYLMYSLKRPEFVAYINAKSYGVKMPRLGSEDARRSLFPLPPLEEQKRIVAKIDELMGLCDELEARQQVRRENCVRLNNATLAPLNKVASLSPEEFEQATSRLDDNFTTLYDSVETVGKLRLTILQLAVQGKLVPQDVADESALVLLKEIRKEKERQIQDRKSKQIEPLPDLTDNDILNLSLPTGWAWSWLGDLARFVDYRGKTPPKTQSGVKLITAKNVRMGFVSEHPREFISEKTYAEVMTRGFPKFGDILFTTEAPLGNVAQLLTDERIALAQRVIDLQPFKPLFAEYLKVCLMTPLIQQAIIERATGMTATGIKASKLKLLPVPIPPLEEQRRIVNKVNQLMALCDELETKLRQAETDSEKLMNAAVQHVLDTISNKKEIERELVSAL